MNLVNRLEKGIIKIRKERDEWLKRYQDIVKTYQDSINENMKKTEFAIKKLEEFTKNNLVLVEKIDNLEKEFNKFLLEDNKRLETIEKKLNELKFESRENSERIEKQDNHIAVTDSKLLSVKDKVHIIQTKQDKQEKLLDETIKSTKEFKEKVFNFVNSIAREYEKRFDKFKSNYENMIEMSGELKRDMKKVDSLYSSIDGLSKKLANIERRISKFEDHFNLLDRRVTEFRKEKEIIYDKFYNFKTSQDKQLKEIEDSLILILEDIDDLRLKQRKFVEKSESNSERTEPITTS